MAKKKTGRKTFNIFTGPNQDNSKGTNIFGGKPKRNFLP